MDIYNAQETGYRLKALNNALFAVRTALYHGDLERDVADDALSVIMDQMQAMAEVLQQIGLENV